MTIGAPYPDREDEVEPAALPLRLDKLYAFALAVMFLQVCLSATAVFVFVKLPMDSWISSSRDYNVPLEVNLPWLPGARSLLATIEWGSAAVLPIFALAWLIRPGRKGRTLGLLAGALMPTAIFLATSAILFFVYRVVFGMSDLDAM